MDCYVIKFLAIGIIAHLNAFTARDAYLLAKTIY